jgi:hypothetical protein
VWRLTPSDAHLFRLKFVSTLQPWYERAINRFVWRTLLRHPATFGQAGRISAAHIEVSLRFASMVAKRLYLFLVFAYICVDVVRSSFWSLRSRGSVSIKESPNLAATQACRKLRAGMDSAPFNINDLLKKRTLVSTDRINGTTDVVITTALSINSLDKKKKLHLPRNVTVLDVKQQLCTKFPGSPPVQLQRLFHNDRLLNDSVVLGSLSVISPIVLVLDMLTGTSSYNRTLSVSQSIEAYVSTIVHQAYLGSKMQQLGQGNDTMNESIQPESKYYTDLFRTLNESIYEKYRDEIDLALEAEREPDVATADTAAWRNTAAVLSGDADPVQTISPLTAALAKEFDLNWRGLLHFSYYTSVMLVRIPVKCFACILHSANDTTCVRVA